jgi:hypothetical protein
MTDHNERERQREIVRRHVRSSYGGTPEGAFERMAADTPAPEPAVVRNPEALADSIRRVQEGNDRTTQRSFAAVSEPVRVTRSRGSVPRDPWGQLVARARLAASAPASGEGPVSAYQDSDDLAHENRQLHTPTAQPTEPRRPGIGDSGRHPDLVKAERLGR